MIRAALLVRVVEWSTPLLQREWGAPLRKRYTVHCTRVSVEKLHKCFKVLQNGTVCFYISMSTVLITSQYNLTSCSFK